MLDWLAAKRLPVRAAVIVCCSLLVFANVGCGDKPDVYSVSLANVKASPDASVVSFQLDVSAGTIQGVSSMPFGWNMTVENDVGWHSRVTAKSTMSAASLAPDELTKLVFTVRRNESIGVAFHISGAYVVSKSFGNPKTLPIQMEDLILSGS